MIALSLILAGPLALVGQARPHAGEQAAAYFRQGIEHAQKGRHAQARGFFLKVLALEPNSIPALNNLGVNALHRGAEAEAERYFRRVLALALDDPDSRYNLGLLALKRKQFAEAAAHLRIAAARQGEDLGLLLGLLAAEMELGKPGLVEETVARILKAAPRELRLYFELAEPLANKGFYAPALEVLERARKLAEATKQKGEQARLWNMLGDLYEKLDRYEKAVEAYQAALHLEPEHEDYLFDLGYEFLIHRNPELAERIFTAAIKRLPRGPKLRLGLAAAYFSRAQYEQALETLRATIQAFPQSEAGYFFLGRAFDLLSDYAYLFEQDWVRQAFAKYRQLKSADPFPYYLSARLEGNRAEAVQLLDKALVLDPKFAKAYFELGKIRLEENRVEEAIRAWEQAVELRPFFPEAHYRLTRAYLKAGQQQKAQEAAGLFSKQQKELEAATAEREKEILRFIYTVK